MKEKWSYEILDNNNNFNKIYYDTKEECLYYMTLIYRFYFVGYTKEELEQCPPPDVNIYCNDCIEEIIYGEDFIE